MQIKHFNFDRVEFAGSLGDLGTLIPLSVALMVISGLNATSVLLLIGLFYISSGLYFKLPIPVQPLKVFAAIAIAYPDKITVPIIMAAGLLMGIILLIFAFSGIMEWISGFFSKPIVRGIQLGLGLILLSKGIGLIRKSELFINNSDVAFSLFGIPGNFILGLVGVIVVLLLISNKKFPAALVVVFVGIMIGIGFGSLQDVKFAIGAVPIDFIRPTLNDFFNAFILLVIPQIPLTIGNAIIGTSDACISLFGKNEFVKRTSHKALCVSMGFANIFAGILGGMPMCHGAGGLAAHHRFGARTGGSNLMIGVIFLLIALVFGKIGIALLSSIPNAVLGTLLFFAGLELAMLIRDVKERRDLFVLLIVAGVGFATTNMGIAFFAGIIIYNLIKWRDIQI